MHDEVENELSMFFTSPYYPTSYFLDKRHSKMLPIFATENWNFTLVSILLNELHEFIKKDHCITEKDGETFFNFQSSLNSQYQISISVSNNRLSVEGSYYWLKDRWNWHKLEMGTKFGSRGRKLQNPRCEEHIRFYITIDNFSNSSKCFYFRRSFILLSQYDFSKIFHYFAKNISELGLKHDEDTDMLLKYINQWCFKKDQIFNRSFSELNANGITGYFKLILAPIYYHRKLPKYTVSETDYYITSGVYIFDKAYALFQRNHHLIKDGYILDTTWRIMPNFVVSILNVCFYNTSLPIAFAFGHGETKILYSLLLDTVEEELNINFTNKILESDEGSALKAICSDYSIIKLSCLRHYLEKLKKYDYYYEIKEILKCTSEIDLNNSIQQFSQQFTTICLECPDEIIKISKILSQIGLIFNGDQITIENDDKWKKVSLLRRIPYHMPSTTNTLEAMHGHLNKRSPRRNTFFSALYRIISELNNKYDQINERIQHNYRYTKNSTLNSQTKISNEEMMNQMTFYETSIDRCNCGQNKLEASNYKIDIPCMHRLAYGAVFQDFPIINLDFSPKYPNLKIDHEFTLNLSLPHHHYDEKNYIINTIKHFSKYKNEIEIRNFVDSHDFADRNEFYINNKSVSSIQLIEEGIYFFKKIERAW